MRLAFITDEMTQSFDEAVRFAKAYRLDGLELRSVDNTPLDLLPPDRLQEFASILRENDLAVPNLAGSFFKCDMNDAAEVEENHEKLDHLCDAADILGCGSIRGFAFFNAGPIDAVLPKLPPLFAEPVETLRRRGKTLLLEADPSVNGTNHAQLARIIEVLASPGVRAIYDPGNDVYDPLGEVPYPDGYAAVRPWLAHVHIKDAVRGRSGPECVKIGTGLVNYPGLLAALVRDGYDGWLSMETHYRAGPQLSEAQMRTPGGAGFSRGGEQAMIESLAALRQLMADAGAAQ